MNIRFYGFVTEGKTFVRIADTYINPPRVMSLGAEEGVVYGWGKTPGSKAMVAGAAPLALALCGFALADEARATKFYQRFKLRVMDKWEFGQPWSITAVEVCAVVDQIETDEKATERERRAAERDAARGEADIGRGVEGPIVWDTDETGQRIRQRGED